MIRLALILLMGVFVLSGVYVHAEEKKAAAEEPYDEDTYGPKDPIIWEKPVKTVVFNHKTHTMGAGLDCASCHDDVFAMERGAAQESEDFTMQSLYKGRYCGTCHDGKTAFASNTRCTTCHIGVKGHARLTGKKDVKAH